MHPDPDHYDECLEAFMDRLSMWQLMGSIDNAAGGDESLRHHDLDSSHTFYSSKGKSKAKDDRDWMQIFVEDVVQPLCVSPDIVP